MIRHRVTIFNPTESNDGVIKTVSSNFLEISALSDFPREDKYTIPNNSALAPSIKLLRVQWRLKVDNSHTNPLFVESQASQSGLSIFVVPSENVDNVEGFFEDVNKFVEASFGGLSDNSDWVASATSAFISDQEVDALPEQLKQYIKSALKEESEEALSTLLDHTTNLDIVIKSDTITVLTYLPDTSTLPLSTFTVTSPLIKHETGIFMLDKEITSIDDIMLSGVRFVIDPLEDLPEDKLHKTLFHVKPRHRNFPSTSYSVLLEEPVGLHPTLQFKFDDIHLTIDQVIEGTDTDDCKLYYYQMLPKSFFIDKYQLPKQLSLVSIYGDLDLEAPEYNIKGWGSEALFEIDQLSNFDFTIHSRYQLPTSNQSAADSVSKVINKPSIFYACNVHQDANLLKTSPFDYTSSLADNVGGFQSYFTEDTAFYHIAEDNPDNFLKVGIPRGKGDPNDVNQYTLFVIGLGITWLLYKCFSIWVGRVDKKVPHSKKTE